MIVNSLLLLSCLAANICALKPIHLTIVVCGDRLEEALTALKSSLIFTPPPIIFHVFTEDHLREEFTNQIDLDWPIEYRSKFQIEFYSIEFTRGNDEQWRSLFKPCCTQRLFIPDILKKIDSVIYIDTDVLFLTNVRSLWRVFRKFNSTQLAALTPEHEDPSMGWYNRFARHPYYGTMGLNSGVMLMNLTRIRQVKMISKVIEIFEEFHLNITWGDQCLLNIYFSYYPEQIYPFTCDWNYRPDHCIYENNCQLAKLDGVKILHGCRSAFHNDKYPEFQAVYQIIHHWQFDSNLKDSLLTPIKTNLNKFSLTNCGKSAEILTKHFSKAISSLNYSFQSTFHLALIFNDNWQLIEQSSNLLKSLLLFSSTNINPIHLHILLSDENARNYFSQQIESMNYSITYYNTTINHPLQLHKILTIDRVIYLNPHVIFLNSLEKLWFLFEQFQSKQTIGMFGQCQISGLDFPYLKYFLGTSNVLLLDLSVMRTLQIDFEGVHQLSTENICFLSCKYFLNLDHCQSMKDIIFLSDTTDHFFFEILYKIIGQFDFRHSNSWNDSISSEFARIENASCRNELIELLITNKKN